MAEKSIGALWLKEGKSGKFMSGMVEVGEQKINVVVFKNNYKEEEKHPDYRIFEARPRDDAPKAPEVATAEKVFQDDIPF